MKNDTPENKTILQAFRSQPLAIAVQIVGVLVLVLNLWLASKLGPLQQGIAVNASKIEGIHESLNRIEGKLDTFIQK